MTTRLLDRLTQEQTGDVSQPFNEDRAYYVAANNGHRIALLVGPWIHEQDARNLVEKTRAWVTTHDLAGAQECVFDVASLPVEDERAVPGPLNAVVLGARATGT